MVTDVSSVLPPPPAGGSPARGGDWLVPLRPASRSRSGASGIVTRRLLSLQEETQEGRKGCVLGIRMRSSAHYHIQGSCRGAGKEKGKGKARVGGGSWVGFSILEKDRGKEGLLRGLSLYFK